MDMIPERLNFTAAPKPVCMARIHIVAQAPAGLLSVCLFASNHGLYKETNLVFEVNSLHPCDCVVVWCIFHISNHMVSGISSLSSFSHLALTYNVESFLASIKQQYRIDTALGMTSL